MKAFILLVVVSVALTPASSADIDGRIVGGYNIDDYRKPPSLCGLLLHKSRFNSWCGCTIIDNKFALTAAHCCENAHFANLYMGSATKQGGKRMDIPQTNLIMHEKFHSSSLDNDICIIKFTEKIKFTPQINKIEIGCGKDGEPCKTFGWGKQFDADRSDKQQLQGAHSRILPRSSCERYWPLDGTQLCTDTSHGQSSCQGDSGGPLYCNGKVSGCTSFSGKSCEKGIPVVFTNFCAYMDWINAKTGLGLKAK